MIRYTTCLDGIAAGDLAGFFEGWPNPPSPATHLKLLASSDLVVLAIDDETGRVVGFTTAISDGILNAHIPLLEVLPAYQRRGIGTQLVGQMLDRLSGLYAIDLLCDPELQPFYARLGMRTASGMMIRNYQASQLFADNQDGAEKR